MSTNIYASLFLKHLELVPDVSGYMSRTDITCLSLNNGFYLNVWVSHLIAVVIVISSFDT